MIVLILFILFLWFCIIGFIEYQKELWLGDGPEIFVHKEDHKDEDKRDDAYSIF